MKKLRSTLRDEQGVAAIEMAVALPVLVLFLWGIFQIGIAFQASAGMQHALGEGARYATICLRPTSDGVCSAATDDEIKQRIRDKAIGTGYGTFSEPSVTTPPVTDCTSCRLLSVTFTMTPNFLFFESSPITLTRQKRVYLAT